MAQYRRGQRGLLQDGTITEWLPLLNIAEVRQRVCDDIKLALGLSGGSLLAFMIVPTHVQRLVHLHEEGLLHKFNKRWRGGPAGI